MCYRCVLGHQPLECSWPGLAHGESLTGNISALLHQPRDANTVEVWRGGAPPGCWGRRPQGPRQWAVRQLVTCAPDLESDSTYLCTQGISWEGRRFQWLPGSEPHTFSPSSPAVRRLWAGRSTAPGFQAGSWPRLLPYHAP